MKLTEFKRTVKVGDVFDVVNHIYPHLNGPRTVLKAQSASMCMTFPEGHPKAGQRNGSWIEYPKAAYFVDNGDGSVTFLEGSDGRPFVTLRKV